jgi:putative chitobiose transport system substrate-binding protein
MEYAKIIKEKTGKYGFMVTLAESGAMGTMFLGEGLPLLDWETREPLFNNPEAVKYMDFWVENYKNGIIPKEVIIEEHRKSIEMYSSGKTVMYNTGPQFLVQIKKNSPDVYANSVAFPPTTGSAKTIGISVMNLVVFKQTKHPDIAVDFALHVTNAKNQLDFCKLAVIFPSVEETTKDPFFSEGDDLEAVTRRIGAEQLPRAVNLKPGFKGSEILNQIFDDAVQKACRGDLTSAEALQEAEDKWRDYLSKEK